MVPEPFLGQRITSDEQRRDLPIGTVLRGLYDARIVRHDNMWHTSACHSLLNGVIVELPGGESRGADELKP